MPDPIVRWRNPTLENVKEILSVLPKSEIEEEPAREIIRYNWGQEHNNDFFRNTYQLAVQAGLYFFTGGIYYPRFNSMPSDEEINDYLRYWIDHYCVPNPYTNGFNHLTPQPIVKNLAEIIQNNDGEVNWHDARLELFEINIGNEDILTNAINTHSGILKIENNVLSFKDAIQAEYFEVILALEIEFERNDVAGFFNLFSNYESFLESEFVREQQKLVNDIDRLQITETEKVQLAKARIGQGFFREALLNEAPFCPITGCNEPQLLIASHIKPWSVSNNEERLDSKNGFLFTPTIDKLFDKGFITFSTDKNIVISDHLSDTNLRCLQLTNEENFPRLPLDGREVYLDYHRDNIFKG